VQILVTGAAGFIGHHLVKALLNRGDRVVGIDNLSNYYSVQLKKDRLAINLPHPNFTFSQIDIADYGALTDLATQFNFNVCVNLAAQAGVRHSITHPHSYIGPNLVGFINILEICRHHGIGNLVYASSSSVYGANKQYPFSEMDNIDHPMSLYAATKKANELIAHTYSSLYGLKTTGLRFFTVYGPWGRPDMALFKFTKNIIEGKPIDVYNNGDMLRDFTYVEDIIKGIIRTIDVPATTNPAWSGEHPDPATSYAPFTVYNIGNSKPVALMDFISAIESALGKKAIINYMPLQLGDVPKTYADTHRLKNDLGYQPDTSIASGIARFVDWYTDYFEVLSKEEGIA